MGNLLRHGVHDGLRGHDGACNCSFGVDGLAGRIRSFIHGGWLTIHAGYSRRKCEALSYPTSKATSLNLFPLDRIKRRSSIKRRCIWNCSGDYEVIVRECG